MLKSEERKLEAKKKKWDKALRESDRSWRKVQRLVKREAKKGIKWFFCYEPKDNMDLFTHIIIILSWLFVTWALFR